MARKSKSGKKRLSEAQEFEVMKLVLDKFLWLGFLVVGWGGYKMGSTGVLLPGLWYIIVGAVLLLLFVWIIVKEFEVIK